MCVSASMLPCQIILRRNAMKLLSGVLALACVPAALAASGKNAPYPKEKIAEFVVEKLDVGTLPDVLRPKHDKGKKTFRDYGYVTHQIDNHGTTIETTPGGSQINIRVLEQSRSGIYACVATQANNSNDVQIQRVVLLKLKNPDSFLKGRESFKEFDSCP